MGGVRLALRRVVCQRDENHGTGSLPQYSASQVDVESSYRNLVSGIPLHHVLCMEFCYFVVDGCLFWVMVGVAEPVHVGRATTLVEDIGTGRLAWFGSRSAWTSMSIANTMYS